MREGMSIPGSTSYYLSSNRGGEISVGSGNLDRKPFLHCVDGVSISSAPQAPGLHATPVFKNLSNPNIPSIGVSGGSAFHVENPSPNFAHGVGMVRVPSASPVSDPVKKKRGRPRKYRPEGANMSLRLSPISSSAPASSGTMPLGDKSRRGRPRGSGWKQQLAHLGDWMNSSAGLAFTPHVLEIGVGEDIAAKILVFAQQRPRALCILSANGSVSALTLRQPTTSGGIVTYEGRFQILCLSGSYLLAESGGPQNRTGGISISVCSPDGHMIGGAIGGRLIAENLVQVVVCSFVYDGSKANSKINSGKEKHPADQSPENSFTKVGTPPSQNLAAVSRTSIWPPVSRSNMKNSMANIDLMHG